MLVIAGAEEMLKRPPTRTSSSARSTSDVSRPTSGAIFFRLYPCGVDFGRRCFEPALEREARLGCGFEVGGHVSSSTKAARRASRSNAGSKHRRPKVYAAWIEPEKIAHWWGRETSDVLRAELDVRVGGRFKHRLPHRR